MIARLKSYWRAVDASYWFYPALFAIAALLLALWTIWLDRNGFAAFLNDVEWLQPARPQGASNILTVIAGAMIGVASTVFSITIAAVAYASGNYGPRLLTNFMEDRGNQLSLATFIGTFVYAIMVLRVVRTQEETPIFGTDAGGMAGFVPQLSLLVAFALAGLSVMVLVYFLNHIPASIRINTVLKGIGKRLIDGIGQRFPDPDQGDLSISIPAGDTIYARHTGYVQVIDFSGLDRIARHGDGKLKLAVRPGDFVHPDMALAVWSDTDSFADLPADEIRNCFALGGMRTPQQDMQFLMDELVEIGLRALSPGINDPFTAITALHWMGAATAQLAKRDLRKSYGEEERIILLDDNFDHWVARGFGAIRSGVATNRIATLIMFDALVDAATTLDNETRRATLKREGDLLAAQAREHLVGPELDLVEARYQTFLTGIVRD